MVSWEDRECICVEGEVRVNRVEKERFSFGSPTGKKDLSSVNLELEQHQKYEQQQLQC